MYWYKPCALLSGGTAARGRGMESNNNHENNPTPPDITPTDQRGKFRPGNGENVSDTGGKTPLRKSAYGTPKTTNVLQNA